MHACSRVRGEHVHMRVWGSTGLASSIALRLLCRDKISQLKLKLVDRTSLASSSSLFHGLTGGQPHAAGAYMSSGDLNRSHHTVWQVFYPLRHLPRPLLKINQLLSTFILPTCILCLPDHIQHKTQRESVTVFKKKSSLVYDSNPQWNSSP